MTMGLKERLGRDELTVGSWITLGDPAIAEIMAGAGFDWLTVDMEHSAITLDRAQELIRVIGLCGVSPLVRVSVNDDTVIKRTMDAGANGVIVPMVNSADEAERAVAAVKYPPEGRRGVGLARAQGYGMAFEEYRDWVLRESVVIVQVEHIDAVEAIDDILSVEGVDACIVGPYDLSASMGRPGAFDEPDVREAVAHVASAANRAGVPAGFHVIPPDALEAKARVEEGFRFIALSLDTLFLGRTCAGELGRLKDSLK